jgi:tRNA A37 threonylcarbamoyladenosine synthetase subunit TsaC/SUA5/YrdC
VAQALCQKLARPLVTTSAQKEDLLLIGADEIQDVFGHGLAMVLDGGPHENQPSTVLSLVGDRVELIRQGKGDASEFLQQA